MTRRSRRSGLNLGKCRTVPADRPGRGGAGRPGQQRTHDRQHDARDGKREERRDNKRRSREQQREREAISIPLQQNRAADQAGRDTRAASVPKCPPKIYFVCD